MAVLSDVLSFVPACDPTKLIRKLLGLAERRKGDASVPLISIFHPCLTRLPEICPDISFAAATFLFEFLLYGSFLLPVVSWLLSTLASRTFR